MKTIERKYTFKCQEIGKIKLTRLCDSGFGSRFFSLRKKIPYVITRGVCPSVVPSVCLSLVEITLVNGCTISISPILFKFGLNIGGWVMHFKKERFFEIRIASCKFMQFTLFLVFTVFGKPIVMI